MYIPETTLISTTLDTTLLWASEKRTKPLAKFLFTTRLLKLGTTDAINLTAKKWIVIGKKRKCGFIFSLN